MKNDVVYDGAKAPAGVRLTWVSQEGRVVSFTWDDNGTEKKAAFYRHSDGSWGASPEFLEESPEVRRYLYEAIRFWQDNGRKWARKSRKKKRYQRREVLFF